MTRKLKIDWAELERAFETGGTDLMETRFYLDLETGDVVMVLGEVARYVEDPPDHELAEWMQHELQVARQVDEGYGTRYIDVPEADSRAGYRDMEEFMYTVRNSHVRDLLDHAIRGRGAFRRFKDVLAEHPAERERWFAFKDRCVYERMVDWLESEEIEPANPIEPPEVPEPEEEEEDADEALLEDLTLLVLYLSSWEEQLVPALTVRRAWKGYLFEVLNTLEEKGYVSQTRRAKSLTLTEAGVERAREIKARYGQ